MRARKQNQSLQNRSGALASSNSSVYSAPHKANPHPNMQRAIGNQAVQRLIRGHANPEAEIRDILGANFDRSSRYRAESINGDRSGGEKLPADARAAMELRFGYDFSAVRIHLDDRTATALRAKAFTSGLDISFGAGRSPADQRLLGHEIAHVVQQATGESAGLNGAGGDTMRRAVLEDRADHRTEATTPTTDTTNRSLKQLPATSSQVVQFDFEEDVLAELHRMPSAEEEGISGREQRFRTGKLRERVQRLFVLFSDLSATDARRLHDRLRVRKEGDLLSERFHDMLSTATRNSLLAILVGQGGPGAPFLPLRGDDLCGGRKCLSDEDLQMPTEAKGPQASYDLAPGLEPRKGSKELKKGRMEWVLYPPRDNSPARIQISFTPKSNYGSQTVTFLQTLLETESKTIAAPPDKTVLDFRRDVEEPEPFYGAEWEQGKKDWIAESVRTPPPAGFKNAPTSSTEASASLYDEPVIFPNMGRIFESVAVIPQAAEILGSLRWGVVGDTILGAQDEDCTDLPSAGFEATMKAYYSAPSTSGGGPEHFDAVIDGYAVDSFELSSENQKQLDPVIKKFLDYPNKPNKTQIAVSGFGDTNEGDPVFASEMRALIVMRYLMSKGVPDTNIDIHSFGTAWARFPASPSEDRNRRVQVRIYYK